MHQGGGEFVREGGEGQAGGGVLGDQGRNEKAEKEAG